MKNNFVFKLFKILVVVLPISLTSCSDSSVFSKTSLDPYTINKRKPLIMPPDMLLRPPEKEESRIKINEKVDYKNNQKENTLDDILLGTNTLSNKINRKRKKEIIYNILKKEAGAILN
tara:strand:+ start:1434 stop:1787 length:354 start_codon:yes stop_codon:yes gene_type:complete